MLDSKIKLQIKYSFLFFLSKKRKMPKKSVTYCLNGAFGYIFNVDASFKFQTEEYVNGQLKRKYGDAFIRGNNVLYISTQKRRI